MYDEGKRMTDEKFIDREARERISRLEGISEEIRARLTRIEADQRAMNDRLHRLDVKVSSLWVGVMIIIGLLVKIAFFN